VDRRADLFSVGVMLWEAATGARMWKGKADPQIMQMLVQDQIPASPRAVNPEVPEALDAICRRALAYDPDNRYPTAADFQNDLEAFQRQMIEDEIARAGPETSTRSDLNRALGRFVGELYLDRRRQLKEIVERQLAELKLGATGTFEAIVLS